MPYMRVKDFTGKKMLLFFLEYDAVEVKLQQILFPGDSMG